MLRRSRVGLLTVAAACSATTLLVGCSIQEVGTGTARLSATIAASTSAASPPVAVATPTVDRQNQQLIGILAGTLDSTEYSTTSVHFTWETTSQSGGTFETGVQTLTRAGTAAIDVTQQTSEVRAIGRTVWARLPAAYNPTGKTWLLADAASKSAVLQQLYAGLDDLLYNSPFSECANFADAASSAIDLGEEPVDGSEHYRMTIEVSRLADVGTVKAKAAAAGLAQFQYDVWINVANQPVRTVLTLAAGVTDTATFSAFNATVVISAPPASEIGTG